MLSKLADFFQRTVIVRAPAHEHGQPGIANGAFWAADSAFRAKTAIFCGTACDAPGTKGARRAAKETLVRHVGSVLGAAGLCGQARIAAIEHFAVRARRYRGAGKGDGAHSGRGLLGSCCVTLRAT